MGCGAETNANALITALIAGKNFTLPAVDLTNPDFDFPAVGTITPPPALTNDMLTTKTVGGTGTFDVIMASILVHLGSEFDKGRITGEQYTKAYVELTAQALSGAISYLTTKDVAHWQAVRAQYEAKIAEAQIVESRVKLETAKAELAVARLAAANKEAEYALTKLKLSTEDIAYCTAKYNLDNVLPLQVQALNDEHAISLVKKSQEDYTLASLMPAQLQALNDDHQISLVKKSQEDYTLANLMPAQLLEYGDNHEISLVKRGQENYTLANLMPAQLLEYNDAHQISLVKKGQEDFTLASLMPAQLQGLNDQHNQAVFTLDQLMPAQLVFQKEQMESVRAQTMNVRSDGVTTVVGLIGKQKDLYTQQIDSYKRDAETKAIKLFTDAWITQKTIDEGLLPPGQFSNANLDIILNRLRVNLGLNS